MSDFRERLKDKLKIPEPRPEDDPRASLTAKERLDICKGCPHLAAFDRCDLCGCFMRVKTKLRSARCPLDKW